jgi:N6-adenosine-specific RNA methylase IME4
LPEFHHIADKFPLLVGKELDELVADIKAHGLRHPIVMFEDKILDGRNRYRACEAAGVQPRYVQWDGQGSAWDYVWSTNATRRHLEPLTRAAIWLVFEQGKEDEQEKLAAARAEGEARRREAIASTQTGNQNAARTKTDGVSRDTPSVSQAAAKGSKVTKAKSAGVSPATMARAEALQKKAPDIFKQVVAQTMPAGKAMGEVKQREKRALADALEARPLPAPTGPFRVIAIDPPWRSDNRAEDVTHRGRNPYPDMSVGEICALPVADLAEDDCILWLWTTNAFMRDAFTCLDAWGFAPKTILTWAKDRMGTGDWLRGQTEHCILAVLGKPLVLLTNQTTLLEAPMREHSRKPDEFFEMVETLCPGSKLEMFAREARDGWAAWGAETSRFAP